MKRLTSKGLCGYDMEGSSSDINYIRQLAYYAGKYEDLLEVLEIIEDARNGLYKNVTMKLNTKAISIEDFKKEYGFKLATGWSNELYVLETSLSEKESKATFYLDEKDKSVSLSFYGEENKDGEIELDLDKTTLLVLVKMLLKNQVILEVEQ